MRLVVTGAPNALPISVEEAKREARATHDLDDTLFEDLIRRTRDEHEARTDTTLITTSYEVALDFWPNGGVIDLPRGPIQSVDEVTYFDDDGVQQVMPTDDYLLDEVSGRLEFYESPELEERIGGIVISFTAGFGNAASDVPDSIKGTIRQIVAYRYQQPENADQNLIDRLHANHWAGSYS